MLWRSLLTLRGGWIGALWRDEPGGVSVTASVEIVDPHP